MSVFIQCAHYLCDPLLYFNLYLYYIHDASASNMLFNSCSDTQLNQCLQQPFNETHQVRSLKIGGNLVYK